jgi:hypothetical protein
MQCSAGRPCFELHVGNVNLMYPTDPKNPANNKLIKMNIKEINMK